MGDKVGAPVVYADISLLINCSMDFIILWATVKFTGNRIRYARLFIAALLGGIYGVGFLFPHMDILYTFLSKILCSLLLIFIAVNPTSWKDFRNAVLYFYLINFAVAGATIALPYFIKKPSVSVAFSCLWLIGGGLCAFIIGTYGDRILLKRIIPHIMKYNVELKFDDSCCKSEGFLDTGNSLLDPLTRRPVVVAEYDVIKECLPADFREVMDRTEEESTLLEALTGSSWARRLRLIPFTSLGQKNGLLIGVRTDEVIVKTGNREMVHKNLIVGIYRDKLSGDGSYHMLIPAAIINQE